MYILDGNPSKPNELPLSIRLKFIQDYHVGRFFKLPTLDQQQNLEDTKIERSEKETCVEFSRKLVTRDTNPGEDLDINIDVNNDFKYYFIKLYSKSARKKKPENSIK